MDKVLGRHRGVNTQYILKRLRSQSWRDGSPVKNTSSSLRGPKFGSITHSNNFNHLWLQFRIQHPLVASVGSCMHMTHILSCRHTRIYINATHAHLNNGWALSEIPSAPFGLGWYARCEVDGLPWPWLDVGYLFSFFFPEVISGLSADNLPGRRMLCNIRPSWLFDHWENSSWWLWKKNSYCGEVKPTQHSGSKTFCLNIT